MMNGLKIGNELWWWVIVIERNKVIDECLYVYGDFWQQEKIQPENQTLLKVCSF